MVRASDMPSRGRKFDSGQVVPLACVTKQYTCNMILVKGSDALQLPQLYTYMTTVSHDIYSS